MIKGQYTPIDRWIATPGDLPTATHSGIALGLRRAAQLQRELQAQQVAAALLARWGRTPEAICAQALADLAALDLRSSADDETMVPAALADHYLGLYLPAVDVLIQPFSPALLTWHDLGIYALQVAGVWQPAPALARLRELGLVTAAEIAVAPAELAGLIGQAAAGTLTTLDADGRRVLVALTRQGWAIWERQQLRIREALC